MNGRAAGTIPGRWKGVAPRLAAILLALPIGISGVASAEKVGNSTGILEARDLPESGTTDRRVFLELPHIRQEHNLCVPASAAMILEYFGDPQPPRKLKVLSRGRSWDPDAPFDDFTITWWNDLLRGIRKLGYAWHATAYPNDEAGFRSGLADVRASLRKGNPVLVDVALYGSHTLVVVGIDDERRLAYFNDANIGSPGIRALSFDELESIWNGRSYDRDVRPALFTKPKKGG